MLKNLRFVKVSGMKRVRELCGIAVDECAIVCGVFFSCSLIFGKVPTCSKFGLQSLERKEITVRSNC